MKKQTKIACLILAFAAVLNGCKKNELKDSYLKQDDKSTAYAGDKKYDVLGYGYDVTGRFANSESSRLQVLDIEKFVTEDPGSYNPNEHVEEFFDYTFASNALSYSDSLSQKYTATTGLKGLFKADLSVSFGSSSKFSSKYAYASVSKIIKQKSMKVYSTTSNLRDRYLTDKFKSDVATLSAQELVQRYGTHVLTDITLGAKFDINYQTETNSTNRSESVKAGLALNGMFKTFGMTANIGYNQSEASSNFNQTLNYNSVGGDGTKGVIGDLALDNSTIKLNIANWQSTCSKDNAALIKIGKDGLVPLEELISDAAKSAAVKAYIKKYLEDNQIEELGDVPIYVYNSHQWSDHYLASGNAPTAGDGTYVNEGIVFYAFSQPSAGAVPVYVYNSQKWGDHYYTLGNAPTTGDGTFVNEGIAFYAYPSPSTGRIAVYVYNSHQWGDHYFATGNTPSIEGGAYINEGIAFYVPN